MNFVCNDYQKLFTQDMEDYSQEYIEASMRRAPNVAKYQVKRIVSGNVVELEVYPIWKNRQAVIVANRARPTKEAQDHYNEKVSIKKLERLINANFSDKDFWYTFGFGDEHLPRDPKTSERLLKNYIRRIKDYCKKHGLPELKYIYVTEYNDDEGKGIRAHHHVIMNFIDRDVAERMWTQGGRTQSRRLQPDDNQFSGLARYVGKPIGYQKNVEKEVKHPHVKRWCSSKNLTQPVITIDSFSVNKKKASKMYRDPAFAAKWAEEYTQNCTIINDEYSLKRYFNEHCEGYYISVRLVNRPPKSRKKGGVS